MESSSPEQNLPSPKSDIQPSLDIPPRTKSFPAKILLGVFFLSIISLAGLFFAKSLHAPTTDQPVIIPTPSISPISETTEWKTYTNDSFGISMQMKIPSDYMAPYEEGDDYFSIASPINDNAISFTKKDLKVEIYVRNAQPGENLNKWQQDYLQHFIIQQQEKLLIDNIEFGKFLLIDGQYESITYLGTIKNKKIIISKFPITSERDTEFDQILLSFQFLPADMIDWGTYKDSKKWIYFNQNYLSPDRNFRLKHPSIFEAIDHDSGSLELAINQQGYLSMEETIPFTAVPGTNIDEKLKAILFSGGDHRNEFPVFEKFLSQGPITLYKILRTGESDCGHQVDNKPQWTCYIGTIRNHGFIVRELETIPKDILVNILNSVEFKAN